MTDQQLATLSTIAWLVLTTLLFVELSNWSAGGSWTIVPGIMRGVRGWRARGQEPDLPPLALPPRAAPPGWATQHLPPHRRAPTASSAGVAADPRIGLLRELVSADGDVETEPVLDPGAEIVELIDTDVRPERVRATRP